MREFSKEWFKFIVKNADNLGKVNASMTLHLLLNDLRNYIEFLDKTDYRRGRPGRSAPLK